VRLAPSAVNRQPWRMVVMDDVVHFYLQRAKSLGGGKLDMQKIDMGIALCHFELMAKELGFKGEEIMFSSNQTPAEEYAFLNIAIDIERFYNETAYFLKTFFDDDDLFENLLLYQKNVVKLPFKQRIEFVSAYNFKDYFSKILCGKPIPLNKKTCKNIIEKPVLCNSWADYARYIIWYGKKDSRNIYIDEIETKET